MLIPIIGWLIFGLIVGALARLLYPGPQDLGLIRTSLLGVIGSFVGGAIGFLIFGGSLFQASGWIGSVLGAVLLLAIFNRRGQVAS